MSKFNENREHNVRAPRQMSVYEKAQRTLMTAMLGEDTFYEEGKSIMDRLESYIPNLTKDECKRLLVESKDYAKLRHAPAFLAVKMLKNGYAEPEDFEKVSDRPDLMADIIGMYWKDKTNKKSIPRVMQKGLQNSFKKFDEYQLGKYKMNGKDITLRDVIRLLHTVPENEEQSALWKRAVDGTLATPDTWEVALSSTKDKNKAWTRLLSEKTEKGGNKLGSLALIRNIRNMEDAGVDKKLILENIENASFKRILPFQIVAAYRNTRNIQIQAALEKKLYESFDSYDKLSGVTLMMVDVSGSMNGTLSRGDMRCVDVAATLASLIREICETPLIFTFNDRPHAVKKAQGFDLINTIANSVTGCTEVVRSTNECIDAIHDATGKYPDRVIVITDEQDNGHKTNMLKNLGKGSHGYLVNVAPYKESEVRFNENSWSSISGWSDNIPKFIYAYEKLMRGE